MLHCITMEKVIKNYDKHKKISPGTERIFLPISLSFYFLNIVKNKIYFMLTKAMIKHRCVLTSLATQTAITQVNKALTQT